MRSAKARRRGGFLREFGITARQRERLCLHGERDLAPMADANAARSQAARQASNPESVWGGYGDWQEFAP